MSFFLSIVGNRSHCFCFYYSLVHIGSRIDGTVTHLLYSKNHSKLFFYMIDDTSFAEDESLHLFNLSNAVTDPAFELSQPQVEISLQPQTQHNIQDYNTV